MPKLTYVWSREEINQLQIPIIMEMWKRVMQTGSGKRKLAEEFTPEEIERIKKIYNQYYPMFFKKFGGGGGIPDNHTMTIEEYHFIQRVVHFFATFE